jgi:hypothetical protein
MFRQKVDFIYLIYLPHTENEEDATMEPDLIRKECLISIFSHYMSHHDEATIIKKNRLDCAERYLSSNWRLHNDWARHTENVAADVKRHVEAEEHVIKDLLLGVRNHLCESIKNIEEEFSSDYPPLYSLRIY